MTRIVICDSIGGKPAALAGKLPLPSSLKEYVMNYEP
jgi:hypothetical protein